MGADGDTTEMGRMHGLGDEIRKAISGTRWVVGQDKTRQDKRLFQYGSQEAGLVKYVHGELLS